MLRKLLLPAAILPLLSACSPAIITDLALSDVIAVGKTGEPRWTSATLHVPLPEGADCAGQIAAYVAKLAEIMPASGGTCVARPGDTHAEIATEVALIQLERERPEKAGLVLEVRELLDDHPLYEVTVFSRVTLADIEKQLGLPAEAKDPEIVFGLANDLGREVGLQFSGVFFDDWPAMADQGIMETELGTSIVKLSDVTTAVIARGDGNMFLTVFDLYSPTPKS